MRGKEEPFGEALAFVCPRVRRVLAGLDASLVGLVQEIRLRIARPLTLTAQGESLFLDTQGRAHPWRCSSPFVITREDVEETFRILCEDSVHTHQQELTHGYIVLRGGHRAGIAGRAVMSGRDISSVRDVSSLNIRVAREIPGAADAVLPLCRDRAGILIVGPPGSGKTTVLRDLCRQLAGDKHGQPQRVALIDERGEVAASYRGAPQNDVGGADVLTGYPKALGIEQAVRCLSPEWILFDELGGENEARAVIGSLRAGVPVIASLHAGSVEEALLRPQLRLLRGYDVFRYFVLLGAGPPGQVCGISRAEDVYDQIHRAADAGGGMYRVWNPARADAAEQGAGAFCTVPHDA